MSNKAGAISLPKGGGALQGIGEKFSPDLHTGTGNFTVPIALPPGRGGFQPQLNLVYSTGNGNGLFGLGWSLSIPGVSRKTSMGVPRYGDSGDVFILSGAEDLVPVEELSTNTETRYHPRTEGLFARIEHHRDAQKYDNYWEVRSKDGLVSLYGTPGKVGEDPAVVVDPDPSKGPRIFSWGLTQTTDPFGNRIEYEYMPRSGTDQLHAEQLYPSRIRYADYTDENQETKFLVSVEFVYEDLPAARRIYPFSDYRAGFEIRTGKRCKGIVVRTHAGEERLVRTYDLVYLDELVAAGEFPETALPLNGASLLSRVKVIGHNDSGERAEELPPLEFGYTRFEPEKRDFSPLRGRDLTARSLANPDTELVDLFGNGLPDIFETNGTVRYWRNRGDGEFDLPREMRDAPADLRLADPGVQLIDADGDGRTDLLVTTDGLSGYYPLRFGALWDRRSFQRFEVAPSFNLEDPEVKLADLDGDGSTDVIRSGTRLECFFNNSNGNDENGRRKGWTPKRTRWVERRALEVFPNVNFADPRVKWADMNGDGLQDIALVHDGHVEYWPNLGHGDWGKRVSMRNSPRFPYGYDPKRILVGDVDGDGAADIVYVDDTRVTLWINRSGRGFSDPITILGTPPVSDMDAVRLVDMLGTGISGVLWSADTGGLSREHMSFIDFTGGIKPYLLTEMDNHMGAVTKVGYLPSTRFYLDDQKRPETCWKTPLPFPVQVVARVEVIDAISRGKLTTEYRYHHGYWDGAETEFRGFGMVEQLDTETFVEDYNGPGLHGDESHFAAVDKKSYAPPTLIKTWFHQGAVDEGYGEWRGPESFEKEFWEEDPQVLSGFFPDPLAGLEGRTRRDALRTLRGRVIRTELYSLDGAVHPDGEALGERPYTVTEHLYAVREESPPQQDEGDRLCIFFPHQVAQRTTKWERGYDHMTQFTFTDGYDAFGQSTAQTTVALPRREARRTTVTGAVVGTIDGDEVNETRVLSTHARTEYAKPDDDLYLHDRVAQARTYELEAPPGVTESDPGDLEKVLTEHALAARGVHEQFRTFLRNWERGQPLPVGLRLIGHTLNHYDGDEGDAFAGRAVGEVGPYGALARSEALVFTETELNGAYGNRRPAYLGGSAALPAGAPGGFGSKLGYRLQQRSAAGYHDGYYADTERRHYDFQDLNSVESRGLIVAVRDELDNQVDITPDKYWLLPAEVSDPIKLETKTEYDYRTLQPVRVTDVNGNATRYTYTPLGLLHKVILEGRDGEGGTEDEPEIGYAYDFHAYERTRDQEVPQPVSVHTRQRVRHASDNASDEIIESREYSDGFGRLIQKRSQAEELVFGEAGEDVGLSPAPGGVRGPAEGERAADRVVVSGWQVHDNKGRVVEKYEPFFADGWDYQPEKEARKGEHATLYYDPRGQAIRTVNPDGSEQRVIFGIPLDLSDPEDFAPTPWESYAYDPNDLAPLSYHPTETLPDGSQKPLADRAPASHHCTPASTILDALGRTVCQIERNGQIPEEHWFVTRSDYDVRGNLLKVADALGRPAFRHVYDLQNRLLRVESIDAGIRTSVMDAADNLVEYRDSKGSIVLRQYDALNRLTHLWARNDANATITLRERLHYGDGGSGSQSQSARSANRARNRLGKVYQHYDEAGLLQFGRYDFKGNLTEKTRQVIQDTALGNGWTANWGAQGSQNALDSTLYHISTSYDALNRPLQVTYPKQVADPASHRAVLTLHYNRAGALEKVEVDGTPYVTQIAYNAKGQRVLIAYGNGLMTRYAYDPLTFRLTRLRSEHYEDPPMNPDTWQGQGAPIQELTYVYDLVGNVTSIEERTPGCGIAAAGEDRDRLVRRFEYDALYRLTWADGRACKKTAAGPLHVDERAVCGNYPAPYVGGQPTPNQNNAPDLTERYTETYGYDPAGNMLKLTYAANSVDWIREFGLGSLPPGQWQNSPNNRLTSLRQGGDEPSYDYDESGNLRKQNTERYHTWDHADRMVAFTNQPPGSPNPSVEARYLYGADGKRVKKWVRTNGTGEGESTVYADGVFEHHRWKKPNQAPKQNNYLHVMDDQSRIALVRRGPAHDDAGPPIQYHLGDHLGSSTVVARDDGAWVNREEYSPYGETTFGSFARKRYRFSGKERDEESGLYYHGARYYAPWLARWVGCDPAGMADGANLYMYVSGNPLRLIDPLGTQEKVPAPQEVGQQASLIGTAAVCGSSSPSSSGAVASETRSWGPRSIGGEPSGLTPEQAMRVAEFAAHPFGGMDPMVKVEGELNRQLADLGLTMTVAALAGVLMIGRPVVGVRGGGQGGGGSTGSKPAAEPSTNIAAPPPGGGAGTPGGGPSSSGGGPSASSGGGTGGPITDPSRLLPANAGRPPPPVPTTPNPTVDPRTGHQVGRLIVDPKGNTLIEPRGGATVPAGKGGVDTHTLYPNQSNYHRLNPAGHGKGGTPHGHGHLQGTGPNMKGQGPSIDPHGQVVPWNSSGAHWPVKQ